MCFWLPPWMDEYKEEILSSHTILNFRLPSVIIPDRCETFRIIYSLFCKLHTSDRLIILHIDCILVFIVYCFLFVFLYHSLMNKVAQMRSARTTKIGRVFVFVCIVICLVTLQLFHGTTCARVQTRLRKITYLLFFVIKRTTPNIANMVFLYV